MISLSLSWLSIFVLTILSVEGKTPGNGKVATGWYAGWHSIDTKPFPLSKVSWEKYNHLTYSFAETTPDVTQLSLVGSNPELLPEFVKEARLHGVHPLVSIGGWTGSRYFSTHVATAESRKAFVKTVTDFAKKYNLQGLDFDWEYPTSVGIGCNAANKNDTENFLLFLEELRADPHGHTLTITVATSLVPYIGPDGNPSTDLSRLAKVIDFMVPMNYDVWGSWSATVGPNAPLDDTCAATENQAGSAVSAVKKWKAAGIPSDKIVLGVPSYGHSFQVSKTDAFEPGSNSVLASYPSFNSSAHPTGDAWDDPKDLDVCGKPQLPGGTFNYWGLFEPEGFLNKDGTPKQGISYRFDNCSQTPYLYDPSKQIMVSYDNPQSFAAKGKFIDDEKLGGFAIWEAGGDYNDELLNAIRKAGGYDGDSDANSLTCS